MLTVNKYITHSHCLCAMAPEIGSALIGAGSSLIGGIFNMIGQNKTNQNNLQIARETNASNERIAQQTNELNWDSLLYQNQFNLDMWNMSNEYNSPAKQLERLRDAGLNPLFYGLDGNSNNNALTSAAGSPSIPGFAQMPAAMQNPFAGLGASIQQAGAQYSLAKLQDAQAQSALQDVLYTEAKTQTENLLRNGMFKLQEVTIENVISGTKVNDKTVEKFTQEISESVQRISESNQRIAESVAKIKSMQYNDFMRSVEAYIQKKHLDNQDAVAFKQATTSLYVAVNGVRQADEQLAINQQNAYTEGYNAVTNRLNYHEQVREFTQQHQLDWYNANTARDNNHLNWYKATNEIQLGRARLRLDEKQFKFDVFVGKNQLDINQQNADSMSKMADAAEQNAETNAERLELEEALGAVNAASNFISAIGSIF